MQDALTQMQQFCEGELNVNITEQVRWEAQGVVQAATAAADAVRSIQTCTTQHDARRPSHLPLEETDAYAFGRLLEHVLFKIDVQRQPWESRCSALRTYK